MSNAGAEELHKESRKPETINLQFTKIEEYFIEVHGDTKRGSYGGAELRSIQA